MEMVINAVMLLHLECANPIDSPRHGGCRANGDRRLAPGPLSPSLLLPPPSVPGRGVRRAHPELALLQEAGSRSATLATPSPLLSTS